MLRVAKTNIPGGARGLWALMILCFLFILMAGTIAMGTTVEAASLTPASPSNLTAKAISANQVNLSWKDNSNNEDGWIIDWKDAKSSQWQSSKSVNPNIPNWGTGVYPNATYIFRVSHSITPIRSPFLRLKSLLII